jgi:hypothetical protein
MYTEVFQFQDEGKGSAEPSGNPPYSDMLFHFKYSRAEVKQIETSSCQGSYGRFVTVA